MTLSRHAAGSTLFMLVLGSLCVAENCQYWIQEESNAGGYTKMNLTGTFRKQFIYRSFLRSRYWRRYTSRLHGQLTSRAPPI